MVLSVISLLCYLGCWQLDRAKQKRALWVQWEQRNVLAPLTGKDLLTSPVQSHSTLYFKSVTFASYFLNEYVVLLDNKTHAGQVGYEVFVPAFLDDDTVIWVKRGWLPAEANRSLLPRVPAIKGKVIIEGHLNLPYHNRFISAGTDSFSMSWPKRIQQWEASLFSEALGKKVYPMQVTLKKDSPYAFTLTEKPIAKMSPERHQGYAIQWFALALTCAILSTHFAWQNHKNKRSR